MKKSCQNRRDPGQSATIVVGIGEGAPGGANNVYKGPGTPRSLSLGHY